MLDFGPSSTHVLEGKVAAVVLLVIGQNALYVKNGLDQTLAYVQFFSVHPWFRKRFLGNFCACLPFIQYICIYAICAFSFLVQ